MAGAAPAALELLLRQYVRALSDLVDAAVPQVRGAGWGAAEGSTRPERARAGACRI